MTDLNDDIERVLRAAGGRAQPSAQMKESVRAAVHAQWREAVGQRQRRKRQVWLAAAASVAIAALGITMVRTMQSAPALIVANVSHSTGEVKARGGAFARWLPAKLRNPLHDGATVMTGSDGRAALTLASGVSLRLDHDTRIEVEDVEHIDVLAGAVYVDSGITPDAEKPLQVDTPAGAVRHVGTQYEVRLTGAGTQLRVREGRVQLTQPGGDAHSVQAGEQVVVSSSGELARGTAARSGPEWDWVADTAPPFDIDGRPLHEFLSWAGRELGRDIVFATPESEAEARRAVLNGSVSGLTPAEAIAAVLPTTRLRSLERGDQIVIAVADSPL